LLEWQLNVASDRAAADFFCAAVGRFHDPGSAASHHREAESRNRRAHFSRQLVVRIVRLDTGGAKDGYARPHEMQHAKSVQKIPHHSEQRAKLREARARTFEENF